MRQRSIYRAITGVLAALCAMTLISCATTPAREVVVLPNDYYLQPDQANQSEIVQRDGHIIVAGPIAAYAVSGGVVAGALGTGAPSSVMFPDLAFKGQPTTKYFVLDTATGKLDSSLDQADWVQRLKALQVPSDFEIYPPLPWQQ